MSRFSHMRRGAGGLAALGLVALLAGCITINAPLSAGGDDALHETTISGHGQAKILWLPITGFISSHPGSRAFGLVQQESTLTRVERMLARARDDDQIKAVVLRIDSPGGTVAASDEIYHRIRRFHQRTGIPVIASLGGVAASGGYYVAMSADTVIAQPTTITGSIGVIIVDVNAAGLMDKLGLTDQSVTSGPHKDILSPLRPPKADEDAIVQRVVDGLYQRFVGVVTANRAHLDTARLATITDGRIFNAEDALKFGLVDAIGHQDDVLDAARRQAGVASARVVRYYQGSQAPQTLSAGADSALDEAGGGPAALLGLLAAGASDEAATPMYLWRGMAR